MMKPLVLFVFVFLLGVAPALAWRVHREYRVEPIKEFQGKYNETLTLERASAEDMQVVMKNIERIQVRGESGRVVAYTSTRLTAVPFCLHRDFCWVFMWKTVYPLPAIYKFNPSPDTWTHSNHPPMQYSRSKNWGEGFDAKFNPLFGLFGVLLLFKHQAWYYCSCILLSIFFCLQITRYRDLPDTDRVWIKRILALVMGVTPLPLPVEPYMITAILIFGLAGIGMLYVGAPLVVSVFVILAAFFLCAMRLGRAKSLSMAAASAGAHKTSYPNPNRYEDEKMTEEIVMLEIADGVATVTLNRPEVHNAFDEHVIARLSLIWDELAGRADVQAVVLKGRGKSFSAGADLHWMKRAAAYSEAQNREDALKLAQMLRKLYTLPQVTIACVFGAAMGGGMGLVSCCDVVIADREAKFALSEVKLGLIPATIAPYVIRAMGERQARRFFQTGERFDGETAYRINFVHELAQRPEDVEYLLHRVLQEVEKNGPQAMRAAKGLCLDLAGRDLSEEVLSDTANRIAKQRAGAEAKEGLAAFLEKRKAAWVRG